MGIYPLMTIARKSLGKLKLANNRTLKKERCSSQKQDDMDRITFDQLPEMVALLLEKITRIEQMLTLEKIPELPSQKEMLTVSEAADFMNVSKSTLYKMSFNRDVPVYKPTGRRVYFKRDDLVNHLKQNRIMSKQEIEQEAINYLTRPRSVKRKALRIPKN